MIYTGNRKIDNKKIKGTLIRISKKVYIVNIKEITKYFNADYIFIKGGKENCEVIPESVELLKAFK